MAKELTKHQKYYRKHKEYYAKKGKEYHLKNRDIILKWKAEYRKKNRDRLIEAKRLRRDRIKQFWHSNVQPNAAKRAEEIIIKEILPKMGFIEIFRPTTNFYFDALVRKKSQKIFAIEVTTHERKKFENYRLLFAKFFKLSIYMFFVKPDLTCYYLIKMKYPAYIKNPEYYYGNKKLINKELSL